MTLNTTAHESGLDIVVENSLENSVEAVKSC